MRPSFLRGNRRQWVLAPLIVSIVATGMKGMVRK